MSVKIIGAVCILCACGGFGLHLAMSQKKEERTLREFMRVLDYLSCELQYRKTPLPQLCKQVSVSCSSVLQKIFGALADELEMQISPNVHICMKASLQKYQDIPKQTRRLLLKLSQTFGRFDLQGQLSELESIRIECQRELDYLSENRDVRLRTYQTLGLCAGAALVILFI